MRPTTSPSFLACLGLATALLQACPAPANRAPLDVMRELPRDESALTPEETYAALDRLNRLPEEIYQLKPGDQVEISVWGVNDMTRTVQVRPDGWITYLLVGDVQAEGSTLSALGQEVARRLAIFVRDPRVTVMGTSFTGNSVSILGSVGSPGRYSISGRLRVLDGLAIAGGLETQGQTLQPGLVSSSATGLADLRRAYIVRDDEILPVDFHELVANHDLRHNIPLRANDVIFVPSTVENRVYVLGEVGRQAAVQFGSEITLVHALAEASGLDRVTAWKSHVYLVRGSLREPQVAMVDVGAIIHGQARDLPLQSGDIIYVSADPLTTASRVAGKVLPLFNMVVTGKGAKDAAENF